MTLREVVNKWWFWARDSRDVTIRGKYAHYDEVIAKVLWDIERDPEFTDGPKAIAELKALKERVEKLAEEMKVLAEQSVHMVHGTPTGEDRSLWANNATRYEQFARRLREVLGKKP